MTFGSPSTPRFIALHPTLTLTLERALLRANREGRILFTFSESIDHGRLRRARGVWRERGWVGSKPRHGEPNELRGLVAAATAPFVLSTLYHRLLPPRPRIYVDKSAQRSLRFSPTMRRFIVRRLHGSPPNYYDTVFTSALTSLSMFSTVASIQPQSPPSLFPHHLSRYIRRARDSEQRNSIDET